MCISHLAVHVQVIRRGFGLWIEVIDVGILTDLQFIGAMQLVPKPENEWIPNEDGFFDLVRNPVGQGTMRPWHQSFEGVAVIDLCLRRTGPLPLMPTPSAPASPGLRR